MNHHDSQNNMDSLFISLNFKGGQTLAMFHPVIEHEGRKLLLCRKLDDGTQHCLHLDGVTISHEKDPWGSDHFYAESLDVTEARAVVIPNNS